MIFIIHKKLFLPFFCKHLEFHDPSLKKEKNQEFLKVNFKRQAQAWFSFMLKDIKFLIYVKGILINLFLFNFSQQRDENALNKKLIDIFYYYFANKDTICIMKRSHLPILMNKNKNYKAFMKVKNFNMIKCINFDCRFLNYPFTYSVYLFDFTFHKKLFLPIFCKHLELHHSSINSSGFL